MIKERNNTYTVVLKLNLYGSIMRAILNPSIYNNIPIPLKYYPDGSIQWKIIHSDKKLILEYLSSILIATMQTLTDVAEQNPHYVSWMLNQVIKLMTEVNDSLFKDRNSVGNTGGFIEVDRYSKLSMLHDELDEYLTSLKDESLYSDRYSFMADILKSEYGLNVALSHKNSTRFAKSFFDVKYGLCKLYNECDTSIIRKLTGNLNLYHDDTLQAFRKAGCKYVYHIGDDYLIHIYGDMKEEVKSRGIR